MTQTDVEDLVIAYLSPFLIVPQGQIAGRIPVNPPTPFVLVQRVSGGDDWIVDYPTVSVHSFDVDQTSASDIAWAIHQKMRQLRAKTPITMPDNSVVTPYGATTVEQTPIYVEWEPSGGGATLDRYVARYNIPLRLPAIPGF